MVPSGPRFRVGDQVAPRPGTMTRFGNDRARGVVFDLGSDGADTILQVRWADGSVSSVYPWELRLQEAVIMSNARKLIEAVVQGKTPRAMVESVLEVGGKYEVTWRWKGASENYTVQAAKDFEDALIQVANTIPKGATEITVHGSGRSIKVAPGELDWAKSQKREVREGLEQHVKDVLQKHGFGPYTYYWTKGYLYVEDPKNVPEMVRVLNSSGEFGKATAKGSTIHFGSMQEDIAPEPTPMGPLIGDYPGASIPPNPEDPSFMYRVSFESGCDGPHAHIVTLDGQGNGTTDMEQGSQHAVLRYEVQPDPKDGHTHTLDRSLRQDVPSSLNPDGQDTSFHLLATDPNRFEY